MEIITKTKADVKILKKSWLYQGFCSIMRYELQHYGFQGSWSLPYTREFMVKVAAAAVLPYDPILEEVVLIEQFRIGALENSDNPWLLELVAGIMDQPTLETMEQLAERELKEETGLQCQQLQKICDYLVTPGCSTEKVSLFCARIAADQALPFTGLLTEQEEIKTHRLPLSLAFSAVADGRICNAATIIALQWLALNHTTLRQQWMSQLSSRLKV